ncbi:MAG: beta-N-acetylglucosaminidase domain-containing protein [Clostridia bacterium]|nr:beta-N-acetylglucosaminidase domain-containing protein [Clostridia bacterium]
MIIPNENIPSGVELFPELIGEETPEIEIFREDSYRVCYDETAHRVTDEQFILQVSKNNGKPFVRVVCSGEKSAFYALAETSLRVEENRLEPGEYTVAPRFAVRGYIEGFYGPPWTHENRLSVLSLMASCRMNTVYYAPKDDAYHREKWRELYPVDSLQRLTEYAKAAAEYHMDFVWCVAPGLSIRYSDPEDFQVLTTKTKQLYDAGIRSFGLLLDDISDRLTDPEDIKRFGEPVNAHIDLICRYHDELESMAPGSKLTVCPTLYHGTGNEYYISKLGREIPPGVSLFWTGRDICSRELTCREATQFFDGTRHKPLYWDNYPVNDMAMRREMHLGPLIGRDPELWRYAEGIIVNCMEYAECSKIPLITAAEYMWQGEKYDAESSWSRAVRQVIGEEYADAFITFAEHMRVSCLMDDNSPLLKKTFAYIGRALDGGREEEAESLAVDYLERMEYALTFLKRDLPICRELAPWSCKFELLCGLMPLVFGDMRSPDESRAKELQEKAEAYASVPWRLAEEMDLLEAAEGGYRVYKP